MTDPIRIRERARVALQVLAVAILIVLVTASGAQYGLAELNALTAQRAKARMVRLHLEQTFSQLKDLESGSRGFALTGHESFLEPYNAALLTLPSAYAELKSALQSQQLADFSWEKLDALVTQRLEIAAIVVSDRRTINGGRFDELPVLNQGRQVMDDIRVRFADLDQRQSARIDDLNAQVTTVRQRTVALTWLSSGTTVALMILSTLLLLRERRARKRLELELRRANLVLEERVAERTGELAKARDRIANFANVLDRGIETERRRLAREVHDQIGQIFTAIKMIFRGLPPATLPADQEQVLLTALDSGIATARRIAAELRPQLLDDLGLEAALRHMLDTVLAISGVQVSVKLVDQARLDERQAMTVFRIVQEASTNVLRHARARNFTVEGEPSDDGYRLLIADDGVGMATDPARHSTQGMVGMRERADLIGADFMIESTPGAGLRLRLLIPQGSTHENPVA